jgi:cation transporter-like permease
VVYATTLLFGNFISNMAVSVPFWLALGCLLAGGAGRLRVDPDHLGMPDSRSRGKALQL